MTNGHSLHMTPEQAEAHARRVKDARTVSGRDSRGEGKGEKGEGSAKKEVLGGESELSTATDSPPKTAQERATGSNPVFVSPKPTERWRDGKPAKAPYEWAIQKPPKAPEPTEHQIQVAFFDWARPYLRSKGIDPRLCYSCPNSQILMGKRGAKERAMIMNYMRAEGFTDGIPDVHLDVPMMGTAVAHSEDDSPNRYEVRYPGTLFHGLRIELKRKGARASPEQLEIADLLRRQGYSVVIAEGYDEAERALREYVGAA